MTVGRKTKLDADRSAKIISLIKGGNYAKTACQAVGIDESTFYGWIDRGKRAIAALEAGEKINEKRERPFIEFSKSLKEAEGFQEAAFVNVIREATQRDWKAAAWFLERKWHKRWGRKDKMQLGVDLEDVLGALPREFSELVRRALDQRLRQKRD